MKDTIIALAEKYRAYFDARGNGTAMDFVLATAPGIGERRLAAVREILAPFPEEDAALVSLFPTEFRRGTYTDDLVPVTRVFSRFDKEELEKKPDALFDDVDTFYMVEGFYLTDNGLGLYSHGVGLSLSPGYIPYLHIKGYAREGNVDCFAYVRRLEPDEENGAETVETGTMALESLPVFLEKHTAFFHKVFALLQSEGRLFDG